MATLREKLKLAIEEIEKLQSRLEHHEGVSETNKSLRRDISTKILAINKLEQRLNNVQVVASAFIKTETKTEEIEVGNYKGTPTLETQTIASPIVEILNAIVDVCEEKTRSY